MGNETLLGEVPQDTEIKELIKVLIKQNQQLNDLKIKIIFSEEQAPITPSLYLSGPLSP